VKGITWAPDKIVTAAVKEVMPHPNADRLVLCRLDDGQRDHIVLTGAPNLYPFKGLGPLSKPLKVPYAREGAQIYDGHQEGQVLTTLKRAKIRGVESYSMICSEKELGISEEHEGVILLDEDAPVGVALADYMGDAVLEVKIIPNIARATSMLGLAREIAALTGKPLKSPLYHFQADGSPIEGKVTVLIENPELNPRFVLGLISDVQIRPSPYWVQRRLRLAGMRPINNIVDATNYVMLEIGEPLHAFDYDILVERAGGGPPTIITRTAKPQERLTTLDGEERELDEFTVLVCDTAGPLSIAGVMGGAESEVSAQTRNVLLEGAAWNFINIRRTMAAQKLFSEAAYRFSRGVHPAMAERGVSRCLEMMRQLSSGVLSKGLIDNYALPPQASMNNITPQDVRRSLAIDLTAQEIADYLSRLEFKVDIQEGGVTAWTPDHRMDIGSGLVGKADLLEEIARIYGYDRIPETILATAIPPENPDTSLEQEELVRNLLAGLGLQEVATYRMTSPEREAKRFVTGTDQEQVAYVKLANPIVIDRTVMRRSLLSSLLEVLERNAHWQERLALFEIGPVYLPREGKLLPDEVLTLGVVLSGRRYPRTWLQAESTLMDFYDLKGVVEALLDGLHIRNVAWEPLDGGEERVNTTYHPGKSARLLIMDETDGVKKFVGTLGELHPLVIKNYELPDTPVLAAELDMQALLGLIPERYTVESVPVFPPVLEDLAVVVAEELPAGQVETVIRQAGGKFLAKVRLFDVYRSPLIGEGKKSLAFSLAYQAPDRTLQEKDAQKIRQRIIQAIEKELGARLR
jgi:phenylalanyl-tRNA synthetase beta chain